MKHPALTFAWCINNLPGDEEAAVEQLRRVLVRTVDPPAPRAGWETLTMLATVKAYPAVSSKYGESVCVAGLRLDSPEPTWIRLFPVSFRALPREMRFEKYRVISLRARRGTTDVRPESWKPDLTSMRLGESLGTDAGTWRRRWEIVDPVADSTTTCDMLREARRHAWAAPSLGLVRPVDVSDLSIELNPAYESARSDRVDVDLFGRSRAVLEPTPFHAHYRYRCASRGCRGHRQSIVDWESGQLARRNLREVGGEEAMRRHRNRFLHEMCGPGRDTYFYIGNQHRHPRSFLVLGLFWPPRNSRPPLTLFD